MSGRSQDDAMAELYRQEPMLALQVINDILEDPQADQVHLNPTQLYRTLSPQGNPALSSLMAILNALGLRLAVQPLSS